MKTRNEIAIFLILYTIISLSFISLINSKTAIANHNPTNSEWAMVVSSIHKMPYHEDEDEDVKKIQVEEVLSNTVNPFKMTKKEFNERKNNSRANRTQIRTSN